MDFAWVVGALRRGLSVTRKGWLLTNATMHMKLVRDTELNCNVARIFCMGLQASIWCPTQEQLFEFTDWEEYVEPKTEVDRIVCAVSDIAQFADDLVERASEQLGIKAGKRDILAATVDAIIQSVETGTPVKDLLQDAYEKALKNAESNHV